MIKMLLEQYKSINREEHYRLNEFNYQELFSNFSNDNAYNFINNYFTKAGKESIFNLNFYEKYHYTGKHQHTVSLFFLGLLLKSQITQSLDENQQNLEKHFDYIWFLSCLFHDTASVIENTNTVLLSENNQELDFYLGKYDIKYELFEHKWKDTKNYNYSKFLIKNYFKYRLNCHSIDHGILGGYLLYDKLRKNYDDMYKKSDYQTYHTFSYNNLNWKQEHHELYAISAHAIIEHNIWFADEQTEDRYKEYGLNELINHQKFNKKESPLLFYFGLLDTIEPLKKININIVPNEVLSSINISAKKNLIEIKWNKDLEKNINFKEWEKNIYNLNTWLDLEILPTKNNNKNQIIIKIN